MAYALLDASNKKGFDMTKVSYSSIVGLIDSSINKCLNHSSELIKQDNSKVSLAPKILKDDLKINWNEKSDIILAQV